MGVTLNADFDLAVVGAGFGGSLTAMIARRLGLSVVLLERGRHPRFAIGESSTPLANLLLEDLTRRFALPRLAPFARWGTWQAAHPEVACGLKRGFTFLHHRDGQPWADTPSRANQLLVAASPRDEVSDTHWYRPDFDHFFAREAQALGVEYLDETRLDRADFSGTGAELGGERGGRPFAVRSRFVVDASGPRGFLHRALGLGERPVPELPATQALYTHFAAVDRWDAARTEAVAGAPYPVDDAAVHHVFDGGWIWVLRFNNGLTSAGVAARTAHAEALGFAEGAPAWERLLARLPSVRAQFAGSRATLPFTHAPAPSFRTAAVVGERWALLPSAAGFVDPLLSTGFALTLLGVERLAAVLESEIGSPAFAARLADHGEQTLADLEATAALVGALYAHMHDPEVFNALTLLYFAAAIQAETTRRARLAEAPPAFLLRTHPTFGPALRRCLALARAAPDLGAGPASRSALLGAIAAAIEPIDLAGLGDPTHRNWHPCLG